MDDAVDAAIIGALGVAVCGGFSWLQSSQAAKHEDRRHREAADREDRRDREERLDARKVEVYGALLSWLAAVDGQLRDLWASFIKWGRHGGIEAKQAEYRTTTPPDSWDLPPRLDAALRAQLEVFAPAHIVKLALSLDFIAIRTADEARSLGRQAIRAADEGRKHEIPSAAGRQAEEELSVAESVIGGIYKRWRLRHAVLLNAVRYDMNNREVLPTDRGYLDWEALPEDNLHDIPASDLPQPVRATIAHPSKA
jgi:hypothetical protein